MASTASAWGRLVDVFPPGFDSTSSTSRGHYRFAPEQFYRMFTTCYDPEHHVESTLVTSVWYGKQKKGARHEFILVVVEDTQVHGLKNFIVLDRNTSEASTNKTKKGSQGQSAYHSSNCPSIALDAFRVSYNGNEKQLLEECELFPSQYLENIIFSSETPLFLYELATLVHIVAEKGPDYRVATRNCYWFAGLIWECLRFLRPSGTCDNRFTKERGRFSVLRYTPEVEERDDTCDKYQTEINSVVERLRERYRVRYPKLNEPLK
ncbi:hypothetical protein RhiJN_23267 [Ceratobasidium sp. AG-Ba]|nr:hypothetical protein RhiJN_23267 [Ceratobasidium sp. AG-Ba]